MSASSGSGAPSALIRYGIPLILMAGVTALSLYLLPQPDRWFGAALAVLALFIAVVDLEFLIIPDLANAAMFIVGLAFAAVTAEPGAMLYALADAVLRAAVAGAALWLLRFVYLHRAGVEGLGLGDVKLAAAGAPFLMWAMLPVALLIAAAAALIAVAAQALTRRKLPGRRDELPFGAFLAPALWLAFLIGQIGLLEF
jgi:leader peptidase (prepilin peptidase)/N-methyltransferase